MQHLRQRKAVRMAWADFCQWRLPWQKSTGLLCGFCNIARVDKRCVKCGGLCSKTGRPHVELAGKDPKTGVFLAPLAELYPRGLCKDMVATLEEANLQLNHSRFGMLLGY